MAPRAFWTGHLRLSLVNIPVKLYPATTSERRIELHQIHEPSGKRIRYQKVAPGVGPVENEEIIKGYEYEKGKYVLIDPKEIDELKLEAKQTIELVRFVDEDAIDDRYYETPYYLLPDGDLADEGYVIIQKALKETGKIGVGQFILRGHGNIVAIKPFGKGLILEVLRHANEVRAAVRNQRASSRSSSLVYSPSSMRCIMESSSERSSVQVCMVTKGAAEAFASSTKSFHPSGFPPDSHMTLCTSS